MNAGGTFKRAPFLDLTEDDWTVGVTSGATSGFLFAQAVLPGLLTYAETAGTTAAPTAAVEPRGAHAPPTLIFTGATASIKGSAHFASFASAKFALRALSQSLAREFGPKGVHVSHAIIDGVIDLPRTREWKVPGKIDPEEIAQMYWHLHTQPRSTWTWEVDIRPWVEKW